MANNNHDKTLQVELFIARLLRWGVIISFVIVSIGIAGVVITGSTGYHAVHLEDLNDIIRYSRQPDFPDTPIEVVRGLRTFKPYAIITLGLLVLIAIPIMRVAVSIVAFAIERDRLYVFITAYVMAILLLSFVIGEAGG